MLYSLEFTGRRGSKMSLATVELVDSDVGEVNIPRWITKLAEFRQWMGTEASEFEQGRVYYHAGRIYVDMGKEELYSHNDVKLEIGAVLRQIALEKDIGRFFGDRVLISNLPADLAKQPDGVFVSYDSFDKNRVREVQSQSGRGFNELVGAPDLVIEVVSRSSVNKDRVLLKRAYWEAGIREYWIVDARGESPNIDIYQSTRRNFKALKSSDGWVYSPVFDLEFRISEHKDRRGRPRFSLKHRQR